MDILFCASEAYPLIKTGGLADVSGSLPKALRKLGNDVRLMLPAYPEAVKNAGPLTPVASITLDGISDPVTILRGQSTDDDATFYLVDSPAHFAREGNPYVQADGSEWPDNAERFAVFSRVVCAVALGLPELDWAPRLVHCNDWQTGLVPALLSQHDSHPATLFTIHNLSYQGLFPGKLFPTLGLPQALWSIDGIEFNGMMSYLKGGIAMADWVTTVSPTYAREICTPEFGYDLAGLLQYRSDNLTGILNGIDNHIWNPETDPAIEHNYSLHTLQHKTLDKTALQRELGLPEDTGVLLLGHVGRLVEQKGIDLILEALDKLFRHPVQLVILGSGDEKLEKQLLEASTRYPQNLAIRIDYDEQLAHRIEAGADCFLMPSRYEPCGLNQMYSLRYGTVPIVHCTGGLADSVIDVTEQTTRDHTATGFSYVENTPEAVLGACMRALAYFEAPKTGWWKLVITGMKQDFSWTSSARKYMALYRQVCHIPDSPGSVSESHAL